MWCTVVQLLRNKVVYFEARVYCGKERRHTFTAMSEAGARTWLAEQGIPFHKQPRFLTVQRG